MLVDERLNQNQLFIREEFLVVYTTCLIFFMYSITLCLLLCGLWPMFQAAYDVITPEQNLTAFLHRRQKRYQLIFQNGGNIRLVVGPVMPVDLADKGPAWRGLLYFYTLHFGIYTLPSEPLYPWDKWEQIFERSLKQQISKLDATHKDDTRLLAYTALEHYMDIRQQQQSFGRQCLLRAICENAQVHHHVGIMAELLHVLLTPGKTKLNAAYHEAHEAGLAGIDCLTQFAVCPRGQSILDGFAVDF